MPITSIMGQPGADAIKSAYRPIIFRVLVQATDLTARPPVVYCDVYINAVYYKTVSKTQPVKLNSGDSEYEFDIQDTCQERLHVFLGAYNSDEIQVAEGVSLSVWCRFRSSGIDANGFIQPEGIIPVQGTGSTPPQSGNGTESAPFNVVNAVLQNEDDQDLKNHLISRRRREWLAGFYPLTNRPDGYYIGINDSDYYPVLSTGGAYSVTYLQLVYRFANSVFTYNSLMAPVAVPAGSVHYYPNGPKNLKKIFPGVDFNQVDRYYIQGLAETTPGTYTIVFNSTINIMEHSCAERIRLVFQNYLGCIDAVNFDLMSKQHETKAGARETPLQYPHIREKHQTVRANIQANNNYKVTCTDYGEGEMVWLEELMDTLFAWMETDYTYIPVVLFNTTQDVFKREERYIYEIDLQFKLSHTRINLRS